jgi:hypothetical protein
MLSNRPSKTGSIRNSVVIISILLAALFVILSNHYDDAAQKWAFGIVGTVLGIVLRR